MNGNLHVVPVMHFGVVDVCDAVDLHLRAMLHPDAAGRRFIPVKGSSSLFGVANIRVSTSRPLPTGCLQGS
ncbi:hypothetical protein [Streptomyces sp. NPDC019507]|uniref:hypothetical protein n=1 Tax=Streptomyces sp. NPDC019507 TaxID=3154689 RepID=UPI003409E794